MTACRQTAPEQNTRSVPVKTIERPSESSINPFNVAAINAILDESNAFLDEAPESVTTAVEPSLATCTVMFTRRGTYTSIA